MHRKPRRADDHDERRRSADRAREQTMNFEHIRTCQRCAIRYDWRKSPSTSLKMTYCGSLCEHADLGFTIEAMLVTRSTAPRRQPVAPVVTRPPEPVAV